MATQARQIFCTQCGKQIGTAAICPHCDETNEFATGQSPVEYFFGTSESVHWNELESAAPSVSSPLIASGPISSRTEPVPQTPSAEDTDDEEQSQFFAFGNADARPSDEPGAVSTPPAAVTPPQAMTGSDADEGTMILEPIPVKGSPMDDADADEDADRTFLLDEIDSDPILGQLERQTPPNEKQLLPLRQGINTLGTKGCDLQFDRRVDRAISKRHAQIDIREVEGEVHFILSDLGSSNGTYLNGKKISGEERLHHAAIVKLGNVEFEFLLVT